MKNKLWFLFGILIIITSGCIGQDKTTDMCTVLKEMYGDKYNMTIHTENGVCIVDENTNEKKYNVFLNCGSGLSNTAKLVFHTTAPANTIRNTKLGEMCEVIE